jgi:hypothetical protein
MARTSPAMTFKLPCAHRARQPGRHGSDHWRAFA